MSIAWTMAAVAVLAAAGSLTVLTVGLMQAVIRLEYRTRSLASRCEAVRDDPRLRAAGQALRRF